MLQRDAHNQAGWLTLICATLELGMDLALLSLASYFIPGKGLPELLSSPFDGAWPLALLLFGFVGFSLVEPFYVAAGFSLYLNRRTHLEGWDVEIAFRRLTDRIRRAARGAALAMTVTLALTALVPSPSASAAPRETPEEAIRAVLKSPEFQTQKKVKTWRLKGLGKESREEEKTSTPRSATVGWIRGVLTVAALVIFLGVFLWRNRGHFETLSASSARAAPLPEPVVGVAPRGERLPSDVPEAALALLVAGRAVDALGLLYRAATILAGRRHAPPEARSWTEGEWIDFVRKSSGVERAHYFGVLVSAWQSAAYAHRAPADAEVRALCAGFGRHFGVA